MRVCLDCKQTLDIPRDTICPPCVRAYYAREKQRAIEQTPRVRARACLYFRPANVTFSVGEQE